MTTTLVANMRQVFAVQRAHRRIYARAREPVPRPSWRRGLHVLSGLAWLAALPTFLVVAAWNSSHGGEAHLWSFAAIVAVLVHSGHFFQGRVLSFTAREVLFLPDKRSVLAVRLLWALPGLLGRGLVWALACFLYLRPAAAGHEVAVGVLCAVAFTAPLAWNVGEVLRRLLAPAARSSLLPLALVAFFFVHATDPAHWPGSDPLRWIGSAALAALGGVGALALGRSWSRDARGELRALWPDLVHLPRLVVLAVLLLRAPELRTGTALVWLAGIGAVAVVVLLPFAIAHALRAVTLAEAETRGSAVTYAGRNVPADDEPAAARAPRPARPRGRSPWRAGWRLHWLQHGIDWRELLQPRRIPGAVLSLLSFTLHHTMWLWFVAFALLAGSFQVGFVLMAGAFTPELADFRHRSRLHAWGVDLREQERLRGLAVLVGAALPALLAAIAIIAFVGLGPNSPWLLAWLAAAFALRVGWRGLLPRGETGLPRDTTPVPLLSVLVAVVVGVVPILETYAALPALALGLIGLVRMSGWREADLSAAFRAGREADPRGLVAE